MMTALSDIPPQLALSFAFGSVVWDVVLSVCILVSVSLFIIAVFSCPGDIRLSPQREAALATGHSDRRTVFESDFIRPIMLVLLSIAHRLHVAKLKEWIRRTLVSAGNPDFYTPEEYLAVAMLTGATIATVLESTYVLVAGELSVTALVMGITAGMLLTLLQLRSRAKSRLRLIAKRVPYALDLIALAMGAGATFAEAVQTVVREESEDPFNAELRAMLAEINLGTTRRRALQNLADRVPLDMLRSIVASVIQAEELGTPLAEALHSQATLMRQERSAQAENAAAVASVRILLPGLVILIGVALALFAPMILRLTKKGLF